MPGSAQPATIEAVHHGSITSVRPTNTGTAECALSKGAPILVPAFLAAYLSSGDEIHVPLGSNQAGTEIHVHKNAASRLIRELYEAPIGYVTRPKEDKRKDLFVAAKVLASGLGDNELATIDVIAAMVDAQAEYFSQRHDGVKQYAQRFISDEGKQNGLYWKSPEGQPKSPLGPLAAFAAATEGFTPEANKQQPFYGYFYRMLTKQGADAKGGAKNYVVNGSMTAGFALVAYPEHYGDTA